MITTIDQLRRARIRLYVAFKDLYDYQYKEEEHLESAKRSNLIDEKMASIDFANLNLGSMNKNDQTMLTDLLGLNFVDSSAGSTVFSEVSQFDAKNPNAYRIKMVGGEVKMIPPFDHLHRQFRPPATSLSERKDDDEPLFRVNTPTVVNNGKAKCWDNIPQKRQETDDLSTFFEPVPTTNPPKTKTPNAVDNKKNNETTFTLDFLETSSSNTNKAAPVNNQDTLIDFFSPTTSPPKQSNDKPKANPPAWEDDFFGQSTANTNNKNNNQKNNNSGASSKATPADKDWVQFDSNPFSLFFIFLKLTHYKLNSSLTDGKLIENRKKVNSLTYCLMAPTQKIQIKLVPIPLTKELPVMQPTKKDIAYTFVNKIIVASTVFCSFFCFVSSYPPPLFCLCLAQVDMPKICDGCRPQKIICELPNLISMKGKILTLFFSTKYYLCNIQQFPKWLSLCYEFLNFFSKTYYQIDN
ncbi:hypothetical protein RFI_15997 [Reticulomyxa filosa]|uniref:Uncharacterized protein n=1 Tax=Reticulomyxa filosa TaxID=46433 RepID=X6N5J5_RETFI|nr:hypothetical protein RFI_15997 [Reticulomyxa filosa]|eukprot:ETO21208.1 hypothetical protein RFI_15997 [Reticulomyxa filosa]